MTKNIKYHVEYQPQLVEEVVLRFIAGNELERAFRQERNKVYNIPNNEAKEEAFQKLHQQWYERLQLDEPLQTVLNDWPILKEHTFRCLVLKAQSRKQIGAELFVAEENPSESRREKQTIILQLSPEMVIETNVFNQFLRRELLHVVDMLDPAFGYQPYLPETEIGSAFNRLIQERYRVLWDIVVDGRLVRSGFLPPDFRGKHWRTFRNTFQVATPEMESLFDSFFLNSSPNHSELLAFAITPGNGFKKNGGVLQSKGVCSLCQFPSSQLQLAATTLPQSIICKIRENHSDWQPDFPVCPQCIDLYSVTA